MNDLQAIEPVTVAVTTEVSTKFPDGFTIVEAALLAHDIATGGYKKLTLLEKYEISEADYDAIYNNDTFQTLLTQSIAEWKSIRNLNDRLALKAAVTLENALPVVGARMHDKAEPLSSVIEAGKMLAKMSGVGEKTQAPTAPGEKFTITINLGADTLVYEKSRPAIEVSAVQQQPEGEGETPPLQLDSQA